MTKLTIDAIAVLLFVCVVKLGRPTMDIFKEKPENNSKELIEHKLNTDMAKIALK